MNIKKLRRAFDESDFDGDGYLNKYEVNHFGYVMFGTKKHGDLYDQMCSFCNSAPIFGLSWENIKHLYSVNNDDDEKDDEKDDVKEYKKKKKKSKKSKKKKGKKSKKSKKNKKNKKNNKQQKQTKQQKQKQNINNNQFMIPSDQLPINNDTLDFDDCDAPLPPSDPRSDNNDINDNINGNAISSAQVQELRRRKEAEKHLSHIRGISVFVMSQLLSDEEEDQNGNIKKKIKKQSGKSQKRNGVKVPDTVIDNDDDDIDDDIVDDMIDDKIDINVDDSDDDDNGINDIYNDDDNNTFKEMSDDDDDDKDDMIKQLNVDKDKLRSVLREKDDELYKLNMEILQWKDKFNELEQNKTNMSDRYKKLQKEFMNIKKENEIKIKQLELSQLNEKEKDFNLNNNQNVIDDLNAKINKYITDSKKLKLNNEKLIKTIQEMTENQTELENLCQEYMENINELKKKIKKIETQSKQYFNQINDINNKLNDQNLLNDQIDDLKQHNNQWKDKINKLNLILENTSSKKIELEIKVKEYENQLKNVISINDYNTINDKYNAISKHVNELQDLLKKNAYKDAENHSTISVLNTKLKQFETEKNMLINENKDNIDRINKNNQIQIRNIKIKYESQLSASSMKIEELKDNISYLKKQLNAIRSKKVDIHKTNQLKNASNKTVDNLLSAMSPVKYTNNNNNNIAVHNDIDDDMNDANADFLNFFNQQMDNQQINDNYDDDNYNNQQSNYKDDDDDDQDNVKVNMDDMGLSNKQAVLLMKARMAAMGDNNSD